MKITMILAMLVLAGAVQAYGTAELDAALEAKAKEKGVALAGTCDDATFLRRLSLDLTGVIPTPEEVDAFLKDTAADKRSKKIEELLARPDFDRHMADEMRAFMMGKTDAKAIQLIARKGIEDWLEERVRNKEGYDKIVTQLITADGAFTDNPAIGFLMRKDSTPEDLTAKTGKVFLGAQIQCAQCHDHPFEKWTQKDFYGMVSFFARTRTQPIPEPAVELLRKGVPLAVVRQLVLAPLKNAKGKVKDDGEAGPLAGRPMFERMKKRMEGLPEEEKVRRMMRRADMMDDGMMNDSGSGMGGPPPPQPEEIVALAKKIREELEGEMPMIEAAQNPEAAAEMRKKGKRAYKRVPVVFEAPRGEAIIPDPTATPDNPKKKVGEKVAPRFLDGTAPATDGRRREQLAAWMTAKENPYFSRAAVNRFFALLTGQPLVAPVDNIVNPSDKTLGGTLDDLAKAFQESGYDLRWLVRTVVSSKAYQRELGQDKSRALLASASARQLTPEQLFSSFLLATGAEDMARGVLGDRFEKLKENFLRQFVFTFENDEDAEVELFHETIPQALMLLNSGLINRPVQAGPGGMLAQIAAASKDPKERIDRLFLSTLSRHARPEEIAKLTEHVAARGDAEQPDMPGMDDPAPMTAREFIEDATPMRGGKRFGIGQGAMGQLRKWRDRMGMKPRREQGEPGGWAGMVGMKARFQESRFANAQAALAPAASAAAPAPGGAASAAPGSPAPAPVAASASPSAKPVLIAGPNPWKSPGERQAYEDIFWSLVSCSEFLYNH